MSEPTAIEILEWLAHKADFAEASIAFGAGGWREHVAPALRLVLDEITADRQRNTALREALKALLDYTVQVEQLAYDVDEQILKHPIVVLAENVLRGGGE